MKVPSPYKCDECNREKQETNHWYLVQVKTFLELFHWNEFELMVDDIGMRHLCSEECVMKTVSKWMRGAL